MALGSIQSASIRRRALFWLTGYPLDWRVRRVDAFEGAAVDTTVKTTHIDARLRAEDMAEVYEQVRQGYEQSEGGDWSARLVEGEAKRIRQGRVREVDLVVPVDWLAGPPGALSVAMDGRTAAPLSRWETADVMSELFASTARGVLEAAGLPALLAPPTVYGWVLTATDPHALRERHELRELTCDIASEQSVRCLMRWIWSSCRDSGLDLDRLDCAYILKAVDRIQVKARKVLPLWESSYGDGVYAPPDYWRFHPAANPMLLFYAFIKFHWWLNERDDGGAPPSPSARVVFDRFIYLCDEFLGLMQAVLGAGGGQATKLARLVDRLAMYWPVLLRVDMPLDRTVRFTTSMSIPQNRRRATQAVPDRDGTSGAARGQSDRDGKSGAVRERLAAALLWVAWAGAAVSRVSSRLITQSVLWATDLVHLTQRKTQLGTQAYPLTLMDALSYHVEVSVSDAELRLMPGSAFVKLPERDFGLYASNGLAGSAFLRQFFPYRHVRPTVLFGRVHDSGRTSHHFYSTKTKPLAVPDGCQIELGGPALLVVRYGIVNIIGVINWMLALSLLALSMVMARASMLSLPAVDRMGDSGLVFPELAAISASWFLVVMVLYAFEKHSDPLVSHRLRVPALIAIVAFVVFVVAVLERTLALDRATLPMIPLEIQWWMTEPWLRTAQFMEGHLRERLQSAIDVVWWPVAVLLAAGLLPIVGVTPSLGARRVREWLDRKRRFGL